MKTILQNTFILFLIFQTTLSLAQEKFNLSFKYKCGKVYRYKHVSIYDMSQEINGQEMKITGSGNSVLNLIPEALTPEGDLPFVCSYEEIKTTMKNAMFDTTIDQKDLIGKRGRLIIDKYGKEINKEIIDSVKSMKGFGEGSGAAMYVVNFFRIPDHPVSFGDKWMAESTDTVKIGEGNTITTTHTEYTLIKSEQKEGRDCLNIGFVSATESTGKIFQMNMELFLEGSGEIKGSIWFDPKGGIIIAKETTSTQDMTYALTGQMKMTIPSTQIIQMSYKLMEEK